MHINSDKAWHKQFCWNSMLNLLRGNKKMDFYKSLQLESSETSHRYIWFLLRPHTTDTGFQLKAGMHALLSGAGDTRWQEQLLQKSHLSPSAIARKVPYSSMQTLPKALMSAFASYGPVSVVTTLTNPCYNSEKFTYQFLQIHLKNQRNPHINFDKSI